MAEFPAGLPNPLAADYEIQPTPATVRTDMEVGAARARRRTYVENDNVNVSWVFSASQFASFREWFSDADGANGGAAWFTVGLATGFDGGVEEVTARFIGAFTARHVSGAHLTWNVSAALEVEYA